MKAVVLREFGDPGVLRLEEVPTPTPGPGEVLVRVHAVTVNRSLDLLVRQNRGGYNPVLPLVLGVDPAGVVEAVGSGVDQPHEGDRVALLARIPCGRCVYCQAGNSAQCRQARMLGVHCWGGYAEYVVAPAANAIAVPEGLSFAEASVITRHFPTAFSLARKANLQAGEWVLIMGAAGGLGSCAVQVAKQIGAFVIAGAGADERVAAALALGADFGVNYRKQDLEQEVLRITEGRGVDVVFENIADPALWPGAFNSLGYGGRLVTVGAHGGGLVTLDVRRLYGRRLQIASGLGLEQREDAAQAMAMASAGKLRLLIDRVLPLREAATAHRLVEENQVLGKVVLDPTLA